MAVYNNQPGKDAKTLKQFKERSWNNPVVRFLDPNGKDLIPRNGRDWTTAGLLTRMVQALEKAGKTIPEYLKLVAEEYDPKSPKARAQYASADLTDFNKDDTYRLLPVTEGQAAKISETLKNGKDPMGYLSPSQQEIRKMIASVLGKNKAKLASLKPDRTARGLMAYAARLKKVLKSK